MQGVGAGRDRDRRLHAVRVEQRDDGRSGLFAGHGSIVEDGDACPVGGPDRHEPPVEAVEHSHVLAPAVSDDVVTRGTAAGGALATVTALYTDVDGVTDARFEVDYELPGGFISGPLERLIGPSVERDIQHSGDHFKALCEALVPAPA
jgi:hypothetical protein